MKTTLFAVMGLGVAMTISFAACHGDSTLTDFQSQSSENGGCMGAYALQAATALDEQYPGLTCIRWNVGDDGSLALDLLNFGASCIDWEGRAELRKPDALTLRLLEKGEDCNIPMCGSCLFDWSFQVQGIDSGHDLTLHVVVNSCPEQSDGHTYAASLPIATRKSGILCRYDPSVACGSLHGPCNLAASENQDHYYPCTTGVPDAGLDAGIDAGPACQSGLVCTDKTGQELSTCVPACKKDSDCPLDGLLDCQSGFCLLTESW